MRNIIFILLVVLSACSCQEKIFTSGVNCDECYTEKPDSADLRIDLTFNDQYDTVPIVLYRGEIDDNEIDYMDTVFTGTPHYIYSKINQKYTVRAEYKQANRTIYAIDAATLKVKKVSEECDETCWIVEGGKINVKLKFD